MLNASSESLRSGLQDTNVKWLEETTEDKINTPYNRRDKTSEMVRACGMYGRQTRCIQVFGGETRGKDTTQKT